MVRDLKYGLLQFVILKKVRSLLVIMDLVMMRTINNFLANVVQKIAVVIL
jgi:hypothetical protein